MRNTMQLTFPIGDAQIKEVVRGADLEILLNEVIIKLAIDERVNFHERSDIIVVLYNLVKQLD